MEPVTSKITAIGVLRGCSAVSRHSRTPMPDGSRAGWAVRAPDSL